MSTRRSSARGVDEGTPESDGKLALRVTRLGLIVGMLLAPLALGQPTTYTVPIVGRTSSANPIGGTAPITETVVLSPPPAGTDQTLVFGVGGASPAVFRVANQGPASVVGLPLTADVVATAPGFVSAGARTTLVALSVGGAIVLGTMDQGTFSAIDAGTIPSTTLVTMSATPDGGAALFVSNGTTITRWDISGSQGVQKGFTISANPTSGGGSDSPRVLVVDGLGNRLRGWGYVGGGTLGDIYRFDAQLDAGDPLAFDVALVSTGRLAPPVTGLALMPGRASDYLLAANGQGVTVYDLVVAELDPPTARAGAFILRASDDAGTIAAPGGVAATNLAIPTGFPGGAVVVGNIPDRTLAMLSWADVRTVTDGGVILDIAYDPRNGLIFVPNPDAGPPPDGGQPDGGSDGGGHNPGGGGGGPIGPGIPVDNGGSCAAAGDVPALLPLLAVLALAMLLRRPRSG